MRKEQTYSSARGLERGAQLRAQKRVDVLDPQYRVIEPLAKNEGYIRKPRMAEYCPTIWIASPGASGSTLLHQSVGPTSPYAVFKTHSHLLKWLGKNCLLSTDIHGFMWEVEGGDKVVYLYAHPLNILLSFYKKIEQKPTGWSEGDHHYLQLGCDTTENFMKHWLYKDILNLEKHLDTWWRQRGVDVLCIKYEALHKHVEVVRKFLEGPTHAVVGGNQIVKVDLPPYRKRKTDWRESPHKEQLLETYASVIKKYEQKPDYELFLGKGE